MTIGSPGVPRPAGSDRRDGVRSVSMAMHLHSSFSEGIASYEAHLSEARRLGVDVLWWTDHDFRVSAHGYRTAVHFDDLVEYDGELDWTWTPSSEGALESAYGEFVAEPHSPDEPGRALRLRARGDGFLWYAAKSWNWTYSTSLADTTVELDVYASSLDADAALVFEIASSHHPASGGRPAGQYTIRYVMGARTGRSADGLVGTVSLPVGSQRWERLSLSPVDDIAALWPDLVAADNSLWQLRLGLWCQGGAADVVVDRLRFVRRERERGPAAAWALRHQVLDAYRDRYADLTHFEALEVSLIRHLNWFGPEMEIPPYEGPPLRNWSVDVAQAMVRTIHERGGLASYNHPLEHDVRDPVELARLILRTHALGADLVELGHKPVLDSLLDVFDVAARNAVFFTGTGVSDDHAGVDWMHRRANYLTNVWSRGGELPDLLDALRSGQSWFLAPDGWRGELDMQVEGSSVMGGVVIGPSEVTAVATELPRDGALELVTGPVDFAGEAALRPAVESEVTDAIRLEPGHYVRAQVRAADGRIVGVGNPVWVLGDSTPVDVPRPRRR